MHLGVWLARLQQQSSGADVISLGSDMQRRKSSSVVSHVVVHQQSDDRLMSQLHRHCHRHTSILKQRVGAKSPSRQHSPSLSSPLPSHRRSLRPKFHLGLDTTWHGLSCRVEPSWIWVTHSSDYIFQLFFPDCFTAIRDRLTCAESCLVVWENIVDNLHTLYRWSELACFVWVAY